MTMRSTTINALALALLLPLSTYAEEVTPTELTKGCVMKYCSMDGSGVMQFFVKVADSEYDDPDTGEHQILGYDPTNVMRDRDGNVIYQRVHEKEFIKAGTVGKLEKQPCMFHCSSW